jgi:hypothetical protein
VTVDDFCAALQLKTLDPGSDRVFCTFHEEAKQPCSIRGNHRRADLIKLNELGRERVGKGSAVIRCGITEEKTDERDKQRPGSK